MAVAMDLRKVVEDAAAYLYVWALKDIPRHPVPLVVDPVGVWVATSAACAAATSAAVTPPSIVCASMNSAISISLRSSARRWSSGPMEQCHRVGV